MLFLPLDLVCWYFLVKHSLSFQDIYLVVLKDLWRVSHSCPCLPNFIWCFKNILLYLTELLYIDFKILYQAFHPFWFLWNLLPKRDTYAPTLRFLHLVGQITTPFRGLLSGFLLTMCWTSVSSVPGIGFISNWALYYIACLQLSWLPITTAL